jgi:peptide/nickel transport system permease protein
MKHGNTVTRRVHIKPRGPKKAAEIASQYQLMWWKFRRHRLALVGGSILAVFFLIVLFCEFLSPYYVSTRSSELIYAPPQRLRFRDENGFHLRPFVYGYKVTLDSENWKRIYEPDPSQRYEVKLFARGPEYRFWGLFKTDIHLFGVEEGYIFLFGTDTLGRDVLTRILYATRVSLSVGFLAVFINFIMNVFIGGVSGYYGGKTDMIIQRIHDFLQAIPRLPLWMTLSAALPIYWSSLRIYFIITIILALTSFGGRAIRAKSLAVREEEYILAAKVAGCTDFYIILRHLLPSLMSWLIVDLTLAVPHMILGETTLSFLGLGLRPPIVSWGVLLSEAQNVHAVAQAPWLLIPGLFVVVAVLAFNFVGDGLRDAADPYR